MKRKTKTSTYAPKVGERAKVTFDNGVTFTGLVENRIKSNVYVRPQGAETCIIVSTKKCTIQSI